MGIPEIRDAQILMNPKDIDIGFEELLVLINLTDPGKAYLPPQRLRLKQLKFG